MATQSFEQLIAGANKIKTNELPESNTASLVGEQLIQMVNKQSEEHSERTAAISKEQSDRAAAIKAEQDARIKGTTEYNVSVQHPTGGISGTNKYTLETAVQKIPQEFRNVGIKCSFIGEDDQIHQYLKINNRNKLAIDWAKVDDFKSSLVLTKASKNLFNELDIIYNCYIDNIGQILFEEGWACSNFIPVQAGKQYYLTASYIGRANGIAWYDENYAFLEGGGISIFNTVHTAPDRAAFLKFNTASYNVYSKDIMMVEGSEPLDYVPYRVIDRSAITAPKVFSKCNKKFNDGFKELYIDITYSSKYKSSDFMYVGNVLRNYQGSRYEVWFFDADNSNYIAVPFDGEVNEPNVNIAKLKDGTVVYAVIDWASFDIGINEAVTEENAIYSECFISSTFNNIRRITSIGKTEEYANIIKDINSLKLGITDIFSVVKIDKPNLLNPTDRNIVKDHYLNNGILESYKGMDVTGFMPVLPGNTYKLLTKEGITPDGNTNLMRFVGFFDRDRNAVKWLQNQKEITIEEGVSYVRISVYVREDRPLSSICFCVSYNDRFYSYVEGAQLQLINNQDADILRNVATNEIVDKRVSEALLGGSNSNVVNVENSDKILFTGCSYDESVYSLKKKSYFDKLSNATDWVCANIGISGYRIIDIVDRLRKNNPIYGIDAKTFKPTYITIANNGNETLPMTGRNLDLYWEQARLAQNYIESLGAKMILGTNYHVNGNPMVEAMLQSKAKELGIPYMGIGWLGSKVISQKYKGFWGGSHPGTRANSFIWLEWLRFIEGLGSPRKSVKVFRPRYDNLTIDTMNYDNNVQRSERWIELAIGGMCLKTSDNSKDYYDRLDEGTRVNPSDENDIIRNYNFENQNSEYIKLIKKQPVSFSEKVLVEIIIDHVNVESSIIRIKGDSGIVWYVKNNNNPTKYIPNTRDEATVFEVSKEVFDAFNHPVGTLFKTDKFAKGEVQLAFQGKIKSSAMGQGFYLCFNAQKASTDRTSGAGNLVLVSNQGTKVAYTNHCTGCRYEYKFFDHLYKPTGGFEQIQSTYADEQYRLELRDAKYYQYDKIKLVGVKAGAFVIYDIECTYEGGVGKVLDAQHISMREQGDELTTSRGFSANWNTSDGWKDGGNIRVEMPSDVQSYPPYLTTNAHVKLDKDANGFPKVISKTFSNSTKSNIAYKRVVVRAVARLFPKIFNPTKEGEYFAKTAQITDFTFDYANISIEMRADSSVPAVKKCLVDIGWCIAEAEFLLPPFVDSFSISLSRDTEELIGHAADNFEMQLADVSVQVL